MNLAYDSFSHLSEAVFAESSDLFVMLTAYLDDSGTSPSNNVAVVAGYLGNVSQWKHFERKWRSFLAAYNVNAMHRADLESFRGEFEGWSPAERTKFVIRAQSIIRQHTYSAIGHVVVKKEFNEAIPKTLAEKMGDVYGFCAHHCLKSVAEWCDDRKPQASVNYVFEAGSYGAGQLLQILELTFKDIPTRERYRLSAWSFAGKDTVPLQAADLLAYELFKFGQNHLAAQSDRELRAATKDLLRQQDLHYTRYWTLRDLKIWGDGVMTSITALH